jgi:UDP-N-acetylglucosamine--N-acetylmuramyl-(pentapeptide) pyrophosphoryl-undecaprenol N-acetylglucosamine transferase
MSCVVIAGTGTGGHLFPALAVARALKRQKPEIRLVFVRAGRKRFDDFVPGELGDTLWIPGIGMPRGFSVKLPAFFLQTLRAVFRSLKTIRECRPDVVVGFGNFGSYGPVRAAALKRIPVFLHEANSVPGRANRILAKFAQCIGLSFPDAENWFAGRRTEIVGTPIRDEFTKPRERADAIRYFNLDSDKLTLLVMGGSQGARHINEVICGTLPRLHRLGIQAIHLTGRDDYERVMTAYSAANIKNCIRTFEKRMKLAFDAADVIVCRAGASSVAEICATGKPAVLVPFPFATDNHQYHNAKYLSERNAALMIADREMTAESLFEKLEALMNDQGRRKELSENCARLAKPDSADRMASIVLKIAEERHR